MAPRKIRSARLGLVTTRTCADIYTEAFAEQTKWEASCWLINVVDPKYIRELLVYEPPLPDKSKPPLPSQGGGTNTTTAASTSVVGKTAVLDQGARLGNRPSTPNRLGNRPVSRIGGHPEQSNDNRLSSLSFYSLATRLAHSVLMLKKGYPSPKR